MFINFLSQVVCPCIVHVQTTNGSTSAIAEHHHPSVYFIVSKVPITGYVTQGPKPIVACRFWLFYSIIFYTASASKYFLQNKNILFLIEIILIWLIKTMKNVKKSNKKFRIFRVTIIVHNHYFLFLNYPGQ